MSPKAALAKHKPLVNRYSGRGACVSRFISHAHSTNGRARDPTPAPMCKGNSSFRFIDLSSPKALPGLQAWTCSTVQHMSREALVRCDIHKWRLSKGLAESAEGLASTERRHSGFESLRLSFDNIRSVFKPNRHVDKFDVGNKDACRN